MFHFKFMAIALAAAATAATNGCSDQSDPQSRAIQASQTRAANAETYVPQNGVERANYNKRQKMADDPTTIIWCTSAFPVPGSPFVTMPIVGKLTSGGKRPYPTQITEVGYNDKYYPELAGPDQMYGSSGEYRYGFTPDGTYVDFYDIATFCTSQPLVWQTQQTKIVMEVDTKMASLQKDAKAALDEGRRGNNISPEALKKAYDILQAGIAANAAKR